MPKLTLPIDMGATQWGDENLLTGKESWMSKPEGPVTAVGMDQVGLGERLYNCARFFLAYKAMESIEPLLEVCTDRGWVAQVYQKTKIYEPVNAGCPSYWSWIIHPGYQLVLMNTHELAGFDFYMFRLGFLFQSEKPALDVTLEFQFNGMRREIHHLVPVETEIEV